MVQATTSSCPESYSCLLTDLPAFPAPFRLLSSEYSLHLDPVVLFSKTPSAMFYIDLEVPRLSLLPEGKNKPILFKAIPFAIRAVTCTK